MRPYSPGGALNALAAARKGSIPPTPSAHRLGRGLPGYLILFAPHAFAPERQLHARKPPSPPVFLRISTNFTSTPGIRFPLMHSRKAVSKAIPQLGCGLSPLTYQTACVRFTPNKSEQRLPPLSYRGCWHRVSRGFFSRYRQSSGLFTRRIFFPIERGLQSENLHPPRGVAASGFRPLRNIPHCCLP